MKVSLQWLQDHLDLSKYSTAELDDLLTFAGIEVEGIHATGVSVDKVVVAQVKSSEKHPDADRLSVCQVDDGTGTPRQIVCGAKNYQPGDKVPLALPGCRLPGGFEIQPGKLRGVESHGMLCSAVELGLSEESDGLLILPEDAPVGAEVSSLFDKDTIFDLEITPNRPDLLSHLGVARELAALSGGTLNGPAHHGDSPTPRKNAADGEIRISDLEGCPYYTGRWIRGVKVGPSPDWLKKKLTAIGLRPINNIVDITNYVLMEMGQPLHAFDLAQLDGGIHVRAAEAGEKFLALDGETYDLESGDVVIADASKAVAIAGVMGGEDSGVTECTTDILLESAYFTPSSVRRTARRLILHSDSSYRFERGVDPRQIAGASDLATKLILEIAGGTADAALVECGTAPAAPAPVGLDPDHCRKLIGHPVEDSEIDRILTSLGLTKQPNGNTWDIPAYRLDLERPVDLIEEVARVFGLGELTSSTMTRIVPASKADVFYDFCQGLQQRLAGMGFFEARHIKLIAESQLADDVCQLAGKMGAVHLKNPLNDEQTVMRTSLIPGLLTAAELNLRMGNTGLRLFELGRVFTATPKGDAVEHERLALLMSGDRVPASWQTPRPDAMSIHDLRGVIEGLAPQGTLSIEPAEGSEHLLLAAGIVAGKGRKLGALGMLSPARARELGIKGAPVFVAEIDLKKLIAALDRKPRFADLPRFPAITRDIAVEASADLPNARLASFFQSIQEPLLVSSELFDVYSDPTGQKVAADRKSLAYSLTYRAADRTLESAEVDAAHAKILEALKNELPVDFR